MTPLSGFAAASDAVASCDHWNTEEFFDIDSAGEVTSCLEAGANPERPGRSRRRIQAAPGRRVHPTSRRSLLPLLRAGARSSTQQDERSRDSPAFSGRLQLRKPRLLSSPCLKAGADIRGRETMVNTEGRPLHACRRDPTATLPAIIALLVKVWGATPNAQRTNIGETPLHLGSLD